MNTATLDLATETRPLFRAGIHGLSRLLRIGEGNPRYPDIRQTPTLTWTLTDTTIALSYGSCEDLHPLMQCMLGDFEHGIAVPPGYETDPDRDGFYVTARQHLGIVPAFRSKSGRQFRSQSLGKSTDATKRDMQEAWTRAHGHPPCEAVDRLLKPSGEKLTIGITPHQRAETMTLIDPKGKPITHYTTSAHPALAKWNEKEIKASTIDLFTSSFACLSYVFTMSESDITGIAIDASTFSEADRYHRRWSRTENPRNVLWVSGNPRSAMWIIASSIGLPSGTYPSLSNRGPAMFHVAPEDAPRLYKALGENMEAASKNGYVRRTYTIPVSNRKSDKKHLDLFLDVLVDNLEHGRPFYVGMDGVHTTERGNLTGLKKEERTVISKIGDLLMTPIEAKVANWMHDLFKSLGIALSRENRKDPWDRARTLAISTHLARAANRAGILDALNAITKASGAAKIPPDVFDYVWTRAGQNPGEIRALLILACGLDGKVAPTSEEPLPPPEDNE